MAPPRGSAPSPPHSHSPTPSPTRVEVAGAPLPNVPHHARPTDVTGTMCGARVTTTARHRRAGFWWRGPWQRSRRRRPLPSSRGSGAAAVAAAAAVAVACNPNRATRRPSCPRIGGDRSTSSWRTAKTPPPCHRLQQLPTTTWGGRRMGVSPPGGRRQSPVAAAGASPLALHGQQRGVAAVAATPAGGGKEWHARRWRTGPRWTTPRSENFDCCARPACRSAGAFMMP
eukprot:COSAG01_NODE_3426_length_6110_cov_20.537015_2_plen_228_part_00